MEPTTPATFGPASIMSETSENQPGTVRDAQDQFIEIWGRMGSSWGISRTMAEVHALLYITGESMCTDDVMERLNISRGNASMTLRGLTDWGIVHRQHKRGDRKEYFQAEADIWSMFKTIARERKKRELDPVVASLFEVRDLTGDTRLAKKNGADPSELKAHNERLDEMLNFISTLDKLSNGVLNKEGGGLRKALSLLSKFS